MRDIVLLIAVLASAGIALRRPSFGVLTLAVLGFLVPQSYSWGFARTLPFSQLVVGCTLLGIVLFPERPMLSFRRETLLLILLWGIFVVTTIFALYPDSAVVELIRVSKVFFVLIVTTVVINSQDKLHSLIRCVGYSLGFYGLKAGLFAIAAGGAEMVWGPEGTYLEANNSIGLALAVNLPILAYLVKTEPARWAKILARAMFLLSIPAIVFTYSRGAWLGLGIAIAFTTLKGKRKVLAIALLGILAVIFVSVAPKIAPDRLVQRYDSLVNYETDRSAVSRFWNWEFCRRVGMGRPLVGGGFDFYRRETYDRFFPEFQVEFPDRQWACHNSFLQIFGEHGFPGAIAWLALVISAFVLLRQLRVPAVQRSDPAIMELVKMVRNAVAVYFVVGFFIDAAYFDLFYYLVGFAVIQRGLILLNEKSAVISTLSKIADNAVTSRGSLISSRSI